MKTFIRLTSFFLLVFTILIIISIISTSVIERRFCDFKLQNNPKYIVVGHSHPECAFNDSIIPNFKNLAQGGESYFYTYLKTKQIIKQNQSLEVVFIEYTNNQISKDMNEWIWGNKIMSNSYPMYSSFMNVSDNMLLFRNNPIDYLNALSLSIKNKITRILVNDLNYSDKIGGYLYLEGNKKDSIINNTNNLKSKIVIEKKSVSEDNLNYLTNLINFCNQNGKLVILIRSPQHKNYDGYKNEKIYNEILNNRFENIEYLDFSKFPLSNSDYWDLEHLNNNGAKIFSKWFANLLNKGLLKENNKQDYIDHKIMLEYLKKD